jgi:hypothetical protein
MASIKVFITFKSKRKNVAKSDGIFYYKKRLVSRINPSLLLKVILYNT